MLNLLLRSINVYFSYISYLYEVSESLSSRVKIGHIDELICYEMTTVGNSNLISEVTSVLALSMLANVILIGASDFVQ